MSEAMIRQRAASSEAPESSESSNRHRTSVYKRGSLHSVMCSSLQLFVKVFVQNGECKTILVDEKMAVSEVLMLLYEKCEVKPNVRWTLVEQIPDLFIGELIYLRHHCLPRC